MWNDVTSIWAATFGHAGVKIRLLHWNVWPHCYEFNYTELYRARLEMDCLLGWAKARLSCLQVDCGQVLTMAEDDPSSPPDIFEIHRRPQIKALSVGPAPSAFVDSHLIHAL